MTIADDQPEGVVWVLRVLIAPFPGLLMLLALLLTFCYPVRRPVVCETGVVWSEFSLARAHNS